MIVIGFIIFAAFALYFVFKSNPLDTQIPITDLQVSVSSSYDDGFPVTLTWNGSGPYTITAHGDAIPCTTGNFIQDEGTCWINFNTPTEINGSWTASGKSYNRTGNDVTFDVQGPINTESVTANVNCILETCLIKTVSGAKQARHVKSGDYLVQLDGLPKRVMSIKSSFNHRPMYKSKEAFVTEWHPVRYINETQYVVAREHPLLTRVDLGTVVVYHFELEKITDDILFANDSLIAESWNNLPHGVPVLRNNINN